MDVIQLLNPERVPAHYIPLLAIDTIAKRESRKKVGKTYRLGKKILQQTLDRAQQQVDRLQQQVDRLQLELEREQQANKDKEEENSRLRQQLAFLAGTEMKTHSTGWCGQTSLSTAGTAHRGRPSN